MATVLRIGSHRFFFYAADRDEPPHIHVERDDHVAKFWIDPVRLVRSGGFLRSERSMIERFVHDHGQELLEGLG